MDDSQLRQIERANPIIQVAIELGIKVQGSLGQCFKRERHPAAEEGMTLFFNAAKNNFFCRNCEDVGGSVIDLVSQYRQMSRQEAIDWLAHRSEFDQLTRERYHGKGRKKI